VQGRFSKLNRFLGDISYPLYIIHYPFIYTFMAWVANNKISISELSAEGTTVLIAFAVGVLIITIALSYAFVKLYDEPVRKWLAKKLMPSKI